MSSYNLSPQSVIKMQHLLDKLVDDDLKMLEFKGTQTVAVYLRQAMAAAEYLGDDKYGRLHKTWSISARKDGTIMCKRKDTAVFRSFKFATSVGDAYMILDQNQDASVLYFPNVKPETPGGNASETQEQTFNIYSPQYLNFQVQKFNHHGLVIVRKQENN